MQVVPAVNLFQFKKKNFLHRDFGVGVSNHRVPPSNTRDAPLHRPHRHKTSGQTSRSDSLNVLCEERRVSFLCERKGFSEGGGVTLISKLGLLRQETVTVCRCLWGAEVRWPASANISQGRGDKIEEKQYIFIYQERK